jgi:hypothetical protein
MGGVRGNCRFEAHRRWRSRISDVFWPSEGDAQMGKLTYATICFCKAIIMLAFSRKKERQDGDDEREQAGDSAGTCEYAG